MMTPLENLHFAIGELAYAVARADGEVQPSERLKFHDLVAEELRREHYGFDISAIIFQILEKQHDKAGEVYERAMKDIRMNSQYLSPELKASFVRVMEKVAKAYPPVTSEENKIIEKFKKDVAPLQGDPAYYAPRS